MDFVKKKILLEEQSRQPLQPSSNNASRLLRFLIFVLKVLRDVASLKLFDNFDRTLGPRYLIECLPYFTNLNLAL